MAKQHQPQHLQQHQPQHLQQHQPQHLQSPQLPHLQDPIEEFKSLYYTVLSISPRLLKSSEGTRKQLRQVYERAQILYSSFSADTKHEYYDIMEGIRTEWETTEAYIKQHRI